MNTPSKNFVRCSPTEAREIFITFPEKAQRSIPGHAINVLISLLASDGTASLQQILAQLFPDEPFEKARRRLTTEIANRVYVDATGTTPLKIVQTRKGAEPALVWLERVNVTDTRGLTEGNDRYAADTFISAEAEQKTSDEIVADIAAQALAAPQKVPSSTDEASPPHVAQTPASPHYAAARNHTITNLVKPNNAANDSLRGANMRADEFTDTEATQAAGFSAFTEPPKAEPQNTVNALDAMLTWAADSSATTPKLLALLGDYGTGKTSHALQFSRVLNGDVAHIKRPTAALSALHIDLAYLRGAPGLAQLNVTQIIGIVIEARGLDKVLNANVVVREVREGRRILVYDGLDELMQTDHAQLHSVFRQLLQVLEPDPVTREPSRARLIVSCRTHYFRDLTEQHEFFNTRLRHSVTRKDYLCLYLLPWKAATVRDYLNRRLSAAEATSLSDTIANTYNLEELASRPVLLAMMFEQVGEVLRLREAGGSAVTASTLYAQTVAMWVRRDDEKHVLQATHKTVLMGALACAMWNEGKEYWDADRLDRWLRKTVDALFPGHYSPEQTQAIQDDLRTATFIVRPGQDGFTFAHRSFLEFFLARHLVTLMDWEDLPEVTLRTESALLPERELNSESLNFLGEMLRAHAGEIGRRVARIWNWLGYEGGAANLDENDGIPAPAPKQHGILFRIACTLRLDASNEAPRANLRFVDLKEIEVFNMQLPPLDLHRSDLTLARFIDCQTASIWATFAQLDSATFRDCEIGEFTNARASTHGLLLRKGVKTPDDGRALTGPWSLPAGEAHLSLAPNRTEWPAHFYGSGSELTERVYADDEIVVIFKRGVWVYCWTPTSGTLRWQSFSQVRDQRLDGAWWVDRDNSCVSHAVNSGEMVEQFGIKDGARSMSFRSPAVRLLNASTIVHRQLEQGLSDAQKCVFRSYQIQSGSLAGCTRYFVHGTRPSTACFDPEGRLVDYDEEAADTWLRYLGNGYPQPVEAAWLELDEFGRALGPKKVAS